MSRDKKKDDGAPAWMVTYSDLMTLLLVFFVLIYSFSILDIQKFQAFIASFQGTGILDRGAQPLENISSAKRQSAKLEHEIGDIGEGAKLLEVYTVIQTFLNQNDLGDSLSVRYEQRGVTLDIKEKVLFDSGKADLKPQAKTILTQLAKLFAKLPNQITVEGHTDNRSINTVEFPSNWELSAARSARVVRFFVEKNDLDPEQFVVVGFGEYHPVASNKTAAGRAKNRRVLIVINSRDIYASGGVTGESGNEERTK